MTLLTHHIEAGWHEVEAGAKYAAEKLVSLPGATASTVRVEADSSYELLRAVTLREGQLAGRLDTPRDVITNDGTSVTDGQHEALKTEGVAVVKDEEAAASLDEVVAAKDAEIDSLNEKLVTAGVDLDAARAALDAAPTAEALAEKDKEIEDLKAEVAAANEALANALNKTQPPETLPGAPEATDADPSGAVEETASESSSEPTSSTPAASPEQTSTEAPSADAEAGAPSPESPAEDEQPPASE